VYIDREARKVKNHSRASYNFRNVYFMNDMNQDKNYSAKGIPKYLHMLNVSVLEIN